MQGNECGTVVLELPLAFVDDIAHVAKIPGKY
jgi:hypothetical protein